MTECSIETAHQGNDIADYILITAPELTADLLHLVKSLTGTTPIIVWLSFFNISQQRDLFINGADDVIEKPLNPNNILTVLKDSIQAIQTKQSI